jgi:predicted AAA+ superfamily ATPase
VACELQSADVPLFYWRGKRDSEIEFVIQLENSEIPINVKAGKHSGSFSIEQFIKENPKTPYSIKISTKNFGFNNNIKSIPLYSAFCLVEDIKNEKFKNVI